jgi:hypothetical protein
MQTGWASHVLKSSLSENAAQRGIEVFIVNQAGEILYPFKSIGQVNLRVLVNNMAITLCMTGER